LDWLLRDLLLVLLWSIKLSAEISLYLKGGLVLVDAKLLENIIVILIKQALQDFEFHHVVIILGILGLYVTDLGHWQVRKLVVKLLNSLSKVRVGTLLVNSNKAF